MKNYIKEVEDALAKIEKDLVDIDIPRERGTAPTQAFSEFLTNKHQGDWAEKTLMNAINSQSKEYIAVKYGLDMELVAGDPGFKEFYEMYQDELDTIGKRPDLLIFRRKDYEESWGDNISKLRVAYLDTIVPKAICGIEVRSSSFLNKKYDLFSAVKIRTNQMVVLSARKEILDKYGELLKKKSPSLYQSILDLNEDNLSEANFRISSWKKTEDEIKLSELLKSLKAALSELKKRDYLSITPKVEDLKVVYNWIKRYGVPHYYVQVFFDSAYGISFLDILKFLGSGEKGKEFYSIESGDAKNQNKTTVKINTRHCSRVLSDVTMPKTQSEFKELGQNGRLLFYVDFEPSDASIDTEGFNKLIGIKLV
ncbi:MAG TPA: AccI family restriction endonuclease [Bacilli bacterium]|nr:AccI family restriction endonuclease [Bacilli bacterium]